VMTTVPWRGWVTEAIVLGPPSMSVSLARTLIVVAGASSSTVLVSSTAVGASSTQVTVTRTVPIAPPLRVYVKLSVGVPSLQESASGLYVRSAPALVMTTVPWRGWVTEAIVLGAQSVRGYFAET